MSFTYFSSRNNDTSTIQTWNGKRYDPPVNLFTFEYCHYRSIIFSSYRRTYVVRFCLFRHHDHDDGGIWWYRPRYHHRENIDDDFCPYLSSLIYFYRVISRRTKNYLTGQGLCKTSYHPNAKTWNPNGWNNWKCRRD